MLIAIWACLTTITDKKYIHNSAWQERIVTPMQAMDNGQQQMHTHTEDIVAYA